MRIAIHTRISTHEEDQPHSREAKDLRMAAHVQSQDSWEAPRGHGDLMIGSTPDRTELQRALAAASFAGMT